MRRAFSESPDDYPLSDVIAAYLDMRRDGRETWNRYAQEKGAVHDLKDGFKAVSFLSNHELYTVGQLGQYIAETKQVFSKIKAESTAKERRIRDIDALFGAIQTIRYWTRKVIPDALPRVSDGRVSVEDEMETADNRKELEQVINDAEKNALRQSDDPLQTNKSAPIHFLAI